MGGDVQRGVGRGQGVDAQQLHGGVVVAAARVRLHHQRLRRGVEVLTRGRKGGVHGRGVQPGVGAVGGQQVELAGLGLPAAVVDLHMRPHAQGAAEVALDGGQLHAMVVAELLQRLRMHAVHASVAHVQQVQSTALQDQCAEGADVAAVPVEAGGVAALVLRVQPRVGGAQHTLGRATRGPGLGGGVVVVEKAAHRGGTGHLAHRAGADAVGQCQRDALGGQQVAGRQHRAVEVLVGPFASGGRVLADGDAKGVRHRPAVRQWRARRRGPCRARRPVPWGARRAWGRSCSAWSTGWRRRRSGRRPGCPAPWGSRSRSGSP